MGSEREVGPQWRKASYSGSNGGACVEIGQGQGKILVRDTTNRAAGHIDVSNAAWAMFLTSVRQ
jgi:hypothetical protein